MRAYAYDRNNKLDYLIEKISTGDGNREAMAKNLVELLNSVKDKSPKRIPVVNSVKSLIQDNLQNDISVKEISEKLGVSMYYTCHLFKQETGITIVDYKNEMKIIKAKNLLVNTDKKITDIAQECVDCKGSCNSAC